WFGEGLDASPIELGLDWPHDVKTLPAGSLEKTFEAQILEPLPGFSRGDEHRLPGDTVARIEIEDQPVGMIQILDGRPPRVNLEHARLHQANETFQIVDGEHWLRLADIDRTNGFGKTGPGMLRIEALMHGTGRTAHEAQRSPDDMRQDPVGDVYIEFRETLLGDALPLPQDTLRMGEAETAQHIRRASGCDFGVLRRRSTRLLAHDLLRRLVLPQPLEGCLPQHVVVGPAAELRFGDKARLDPDHALLDARGKRPPERRLCRLDLGKLLTERARNPGRKASTGTPRINELSVFVIADDERADRASRHRG